MKTTADGLLVSMRKWGKPRSSLYVANPLVGMLRLHLNVYLKPCPEARDSDLPADETLLKVHQKLCFKKRKSVACCLGAKRKE